MPTAPAPIATYLANLTLNFYNLADVRATGDAVIQVIGGNGSISIPVAQGVQGFSVYGGSTVPTAASPAAAAPMDQYIYAGTGATAPLVVNTGDVLRKAGDGTWVVVGNIRGPQGIQGIPGLKGDPGPGGATTLNDRGAWAATTAYAYNDVVTASGQRWLNKTPHTSGATFSGATNWVPLTLPGAGVVARARRITAAALASGTTLASSSAIASLANIPVTAGRLYRVYTSSLLVYSNGATTMAVAQAAVTYTTDGTAPSASSALLKQDDVQVGIGGSPATLAISVSYAPTVTGLLGLLLSYFMPVTGGGTSVGISGTATAPIELVVEDIGVDPGATGNVSY